MKTGCTLCAGIFEEHTPVMETGQFAVIPSLGALVPGHVLLVPKSHQLRLADISASELAEYQIFRRQTVRLLERTFAAPVHQFEHGSNAAGTRTPCTIEHAHLHLLPAPVEVRGQLEREYQWKSYAASEIGSGEYLYYRPPEGSEIVTEGASFPSQYLRRIFAEALGVNEWNWRADARKSVVEETYRRLDAGKIRA